MSEPERPSTSGQGDSGALFPGYARLAAYQTREGCFCGKARGHAGWLVCVFGERPSASGSPDKAAPSDRRET